MGLGHLTRYGVLYTKGMICTKGNTGESSNIWHDHFSFHYRHAGLRRVILSRGKANGYIFECGLKVGGVGNFRDL